MHTQKHSAAQKSRLPGIPSLSLEERERALPKQLISAPYPTRASAPLPVPTGRWSRLVRKGLALPAGSTSSNGCYFYPFCFHPNSLVRERPVPFPANLESREKFSCEMSSARTLRSRGTTPWSVRARHVPWLPLVPCSTCLTEQPSSRCLLIVKPLLVWFAQHAYGKSTGIMWITF